MGRPIRRPLQSPWWEVGVAGMWMLVELVRLVGPGREWSASLLRMCYRDRATEGLDVTKRLRAEILEGRILRGRTFQGIVAFVVILSSLFVENRASEELLF